jgi:prevent-host-death family protein
MAERRPKKPRTVPAGRFKAECLGLFDRVAEGREVYVVTKRGRPVAQVGPVTTNRARLSGSVTFKGDVVSSILGSWDAEG